MPALLESEWLTSSFLCLHEVVHCLSSWTWQFFQFYENGASSAGSLSGFGPPS